MKYKFMTAGLFVLLITMSLLATSAFANIINFKVEASADSIDSALTPYFNIGEEITLQFNMDLDIIGFENAWFSSNIQLSAMEFSIGTYNGSVQSYRPSITNGPSCSYTCGDVWTAEAKNDFGTIFNFPSFDDFYLDIIQLEYRDDTGTALNTQNMTASIDQLDNFSSWHLALYFKDIKNVGSHRISIRSELPKVTITSVPSPSILSIFVLGLIGLGLNQMDRPFR
jgi:hypothetical protein